MSTPPASGLSPGNQAMLDTIKTHAVTYGKKALDAGRNSVAEAHEAGMFKLESVGKFNSDLLHIVKTIKGTVDRTSAGEITAQQVGRRLPPVGHTRTVTPPAAAKHRQS